MKKLFIVLMALVMAGTCAACAQNPSESAGPTKDALTPGASPGADFRRYNRAHDSIFHGYAHAQRA